MRPALGSQESPRSGLKYSKQKVVARTGSPEVNSFRKRAMSSHKSAQGQSGLSACGLWSWGHLLAMAVPLLMVLSSAIGPALEARSSRGLGNTQSMVLASTLLQAENSQAAPTGRRWERSLVGSSAPKSEPLQPTYTGPSFLGFDCFADKTPNVLKMPTACRTSAGGRKYSGREKMAGRR